MSVVLVVLWAASAATVVASQAPGEAKEWLHDAVREGDETAVRTALSRGARELANTPDQFGFTPIYFARDRKVAQLLVEAGANVHWSKNNLGWTPLHYAADNNMIALSEVLLDNGADLKAKTMNGATRGSDAMALAARKYHVNVVRALVRAGADPTLPVDGGQSAIEMMPELDESRPKYESDMQKKLKKMREIINKQSSKELRRL